MAYLAFTEIEAPHAALSIAAPVAASKIASDFSPLEWSIVALAQHDPRSSIQPEMKITQWLRALFGFERKNPLADERLEALRRMAVLAWHEGYATAVSEVRAFFRAGYSTDQYEALLGRISAGRTARPRRFFA